MVSVINNPENVPGYLAGSSPTPSGFVFDVGQEFLRIRGIVNFAETSQVPVCILSDALDSKSAYIQPDLADWRHPTRIDSYFQGRPENSVVGFGKVGSPGNPAVLQNSPVTNYVYMVDFLAQPPVKQRWCPAVQVRPLKRRSSYLQPPTLAKSMSIEEFLFLDPEPRGPTFDSYSSLSLPVVALKPPKMINV